MIAMPKLSRGIMLEGISCAGKTSTMYALKKLFANDLNLERNIIMLGEHYTQVLNSINGKYVNHEYAEHTEMLFKRVEMLEQLYEWACYLGDFRRASRGLYSVFERGLINHIACYKDFDSPEIKELAKRFTSLGIEAILLIISDEFLEKKIRHRAEQSKTSNTDSYYKEQSKKAKEHQENMLSAIHRTDLPFRIICTDSMNWDEYARKIVYNDNSAV
jgi:thymidylate kinase